MSELPKGWVTTPLKVLVDSKKGKKPKHLTDKLSKEVVPYIDIKAFEKGILTKYGKLEDGVNATSSDSLMVWDGARSGLVGRGVEGIIGSTLVKITPIEGDKDYFHYFFQSLFSLINSKTKGTGIPHVDPAVLWNVDFPLAPLNEQTRIANKLNSMLAKVDAAQTRLDKIPHILKRFRQSVLAAATSGELTKKWREEERLIPSIMSTWEVKNLPSSWQIKLLPEVGSSRLGKMLDKNKNEGVKTKYIGNINVRWNSFDLNDLKEIKVSDKEVNELSIKDGDLIICEGGVPGRGAIWKGGENNLVFQKALHRIRFNGLVLPDFALYCLQDDFNSNKLASLYTGTTIKHLTGKALKSYPLRIPQMAEQKEIVRRVESLFAMADTVEKQFLEAKVRTNRLTQSILAKAFRGELVPQDPNDQPASELLARIKEKQSKNKPKETKKRTNAKKATSTPLVKVKNKKIISPPSDIINIENPSKEISYESWLGDNSVYAKSAIQNLQESTFTVEQFQSITNFSKTYEELKNLLLDLVKGIPGQQEPLIEIADWNEKTGEYDFRLKASK